MASTSSAPRRLARARRPLLPQPADRAAASPSPSARRRSARSPAAQTVVVPDEIWEEILLRLDAAADLARASAACSCFRRIVSDGRFLGRFRSRRSPAVLGLIMDQSFFPAGQPHRSAREARALEQAADFSFSFLPDASEWMFRHARDGRMLLARRISNEFQIRLAVCDPLYRRYAMIPRIPDDLLAACALVDYGMARHLLPVLAPAGDNDGEESLSFRVICIMQLQDKAMAFVFSSRDQTWRGIASTIPLPNATVGCIHYYAHGCLYSMLYPVDGYPMSSYSIMLDTTEMQFSVIDLPLHSRDAKCAIVEAGEGRLGFLALGDGTIDLYCKDWQRNGVGAQGWQHDKLIPLPKESGITYRWAIVGTVGRYLALLADHVTCDESLPHCEYFLLDMKTLLVEKLYISTSAMCRGFPYVGFPPLLALPRI